MKEAFVEVTGRANAGSISRASYVTPQLPDTRGKYYQPRATRRLQRRGTGRAGGPGSPGADRAERSLEGRVVQHAATRHGGRAAGGDRRPGGPGRAQGS